MSRASARTAGFVLKQLDRRRANDLFNLIALRQFAVDQFNRKIAQFAINKKQRARSGFCPDTAPP